MNRAAFGSGSSHALGPAALNLAAFPPIRRVADARTLIKCALSEERGVIGVLDDDPTGSQSVYGVDVVTTLDPLEYDAGLARSGTCFVLTNSRGMTEQLAVATSGEVAEAMYHIASRRGYSLQLISRSDSTLRGHVVAEINALREVHHRATGTDYDGVLLVPAFFEAGRVTAGDVQWVRIGDEFVPVSETDYARDSTFGYRSSNLREFIAEKSAGAISGDSVLSIGLDDIREGGPDRVREILGQASDARWVIVNGTSYEDLEIVVLGLCAARRRGQTFAYRTGPSFVQVLAGQTPQSPLSQRELWPVGPRPGYGLVVVGSHVSQTTRQLDYVRHWLPDVVVIELDAAVLAEQDSDARLTYLGDAGRRVGNALAKGDVITTTTRTLLNGVDGATSLRLAKRISQGVSEVVARVVRGHRPAWVLTKGGITSHDVGVTGLGVRRATVAGQLFPGLISVMIPTAAPPETLGMPWIVFAGNVGGDETLSHVIELLRKSR